jgi:hypothetical protein
MIWIALSAVLVVVLAALAVLAALIVAYPIAFVLKRIDDWLYFRRARRISAARLGLVPSPLLTPHPPCGVAGEVGGINPADLYPRHPVHSARPPEVRARNAFFGISLGSGLSLRGFVQALPGVVKRLVVPLFAHLHGLRLSRSWVKP